MNGTIIEVHVTVKNIFRLLYEQSEAAGGMPLESPGMDVPGFENYP